MQFTAGIITVSDKGYAGERKDTSGEKIAAILKANDWEVVCRTIVPDEKDKIAEAVKAYSDEKNLCLIITTGGTGFSKRDVTPEATALVIERECPGIPEAMRAESMRITPRGMLSREKAGIRGDSLIINLPGSEKAAGECLNAVISPVRHGVEMIRGWAGECAQRFKHEDIHNEQKR